MRIISLKGLHVMVLYYCIPSFLDVADVRCSIFCKIHMAEPQDSKEISLAVAADRTCNYRI